MQPPKTTTVIGYFNNNAFPVHLSDGRLGLSVTVAPGEFVKDNQKNKVNDPVLEQFVGPHMLSIEKSKGDQVPVRRIIPPEAAPNNPYGFEAKNEVKRDAEGVLVTPAPTTQFPPQKNNVNPVTALSVEEAKRLGLIRPTRNIDIENQGVQEERVKDGKDVPYLPIAEDVPAKKSAAPTPPTPAPALPPETVPVPEKAKATIDSLKAAAATDPTDLNSVLKTVTGGMNLPPPKLDPVPPTGGPSAEQVARMDPTVKVPDMTVKVPNMPFICSVDGNKFKYRSELERHAKRTYDPTTVQKIMAPYPPTKRKG